MSSSYSMYGNYYGLRIFFLPAWRVVLRYMKMSVRNQLTHYELEEFCRSLQDLLVLSLNPSLSFDCAEFLSRRLDGRFERTLSVLSSRLVRFVLVRSTTTFWPRHFLIYCQSTKATLRGLTLFRFAREDERTTFNRQSGCCEIRCSRSPEARYFRRFVGSTS